MDIILGAGRLASACPVVAALGFLLATGLTCGASSEDELIIPASDVRTGEARLYEVENRQVWVLRDNAGVYAYDASPQHPSCLGSAVEFEAAWDGQMWVSDPRFNTFFRDPCVGSRFDLEGKLVAGPAYRDLDRHSASLEGSDIVVDLDSSVKGECHVDDCSTLQ